MMSNTYIGTWKSHWNKKWQGKGKKTCFKKKDTLDPEVVGGNNGRKLQNQTQINHFVHSVQSNWLKSDILGTTSEKNK